MEETIKQIKQIFNLWNIRHITVKDFLQHLGKSPGLKLILGSLGFWALLRLFIKVSIGLHLIAFLLRLIAYVTG